MRRTVKLGLVAFGFLASIAVGQEREVDPNVGFLRIVSLVAAGEGKMGLRMDGKNHWGEGFQLGDRTGGFKRKAGTVEFILSKEGCQTAKKSIDVVRGRTMTLVCYSDPIRDDLGQIVDWELKMSTLSQQEEPGGLFFTIISFLEADEVVLKVEDSNSEKVQSIVAKKRKATRVQVKPGLVNVKISHKDEVIKNLTTDRRGNYVVMFYPDAEGKTESVTFYDRKFVIGN